MGIRTRIQDREWHEYPLGTKAHSVMGGYWHKTNTGWKWCTGSTFPTPGADWREIELPDGDHCAALSVPEKGE